jgi:hypothetical protein
MEFEDQLKKVSSFHSAPLVVTSLFQWDQHNVGLVFPKSDVWKVVFAEAISFLNPWSNVNLSGVIES